MVLPSLAAAEMLAAEGISVSVVNCRYLKPYDELTLAAVVADHRQLLVVEEGSEPERMSQSHFTARVSVKTIKNLSCGPRSVRGRNLMSSGRAG